MSHHLRDTVGAPTVDAGRGDLARSSNGDALAVGPVSATECERAILGDASDFCRASADAAPAGTGDGRGAGVGMAWLRGAGAGAAPPDSACRLRVQNGASVLRAA